MSCKFRHLWTYLNRTECSAKESIVTRARNRLVGTLGWLGILTAANFP